MKCPISQELFQDPVIAAGTYMLTMIMCHLLIVSDGHTYERSAIMSWLMEGNRRSPVTNTILPNTMLIQNHCIKAIMVYIHHTS